MAANYVREKILRLMAEHSGNFTPLVCKAEKFEIIQEEARQMREDGLIFGFRCFDGLPGDTIVTIAEKDSFKNKDEKLLYLTNDWEAERELPLWNV